MFQFNIRKKFAPSKLKKDRTKFPFRDRSMLPAVLLGTISYSLLWGFSMLNPDVEITFNLAMGLGWVNALNIFIIGAVMDLEYVVDCLVRRCQRRSK